MLSVLNKGYSLVITCRGHPAFGRSWSAHPAHFLLSDYLPVYPFFSLHDTSLVCFSFG